MATAGKTDWPNLLKLYRTRSTSRAMFCQKHGVTLSTLDYLSDLSSETSY